MQAKKSMRLNLSGVRQEDDQVSTLNDRVSSTLKGKLVLSGQRSLTKATHRRNVIDVTNTGSSLPIKQKTIEAVDKGDTMKNVQSYFQSSRRGGKFGKKN